MKTNTRISDAGANQLRRPAPRSRPVELQMLAIRASKQPPTIPAPIRCDCADGKCGQCHSCRGTRQVPVMIRVVKGAAQ